GHGRPLDGRARRASRQGPPRPVHRAARRPGGRSGRGVRAPRPAARAPRLEGALLVSDALREKIRAIDKELVSLTARRLDLARRVGEIKRAKGVPIRNYQVEAEALRLVREAAAELGVDPALAEDLLKLEIR